VRNKQAQMMGVFAELERVIIRDLRRAI